MPPSRTPTKWSVEYDTTRRQKLFQHPPKDRSAYPALAAAVRPHIQAFDALFHDQALVAKGLKDIGTYTVVDGGTHNENRVLDQNQLDLRATDVVLEKPVLASSNRYTVNNRDIYPSECRERHVSYRGRLKVKLEWRVNQGKWQENWRDMGLMPVMLKTKHCHLADLTPYQLMQHREDTEEQGGYFIINGNERLIRLLSLPRRNYPMAIIRSGFASRGPTFTKYAVQIRSVRPDQTSQTNVLHYLSDGNVTLRFSWRKNEYLIPVMMILNALVETNDKEIFEGIVGPERSNSRDNFVINRLEVLLRTYKAYGLPTSQRTKAYLGEKFRPILNLPVTMSNKAAGEQLLEKVVLPHLGNCNATETQNNDKFRQLLFMVRKLYALSAGECAVDDPDLVANQEVILGGFLCGMILKERIQEWIVSVGNLAVMWATAKDSRSFTDLTFRTDFNSKVLGRSVERIGSSIEYFLATGNLISSSGLDLSQSSGYTISAERINFYRFLSHFRMVHRGSFFADLKTTTVRRLLPESWGFLCPIHTPDGSPCGLLNHLAHRCDIHVGALDTTSLTDALFEFDISQVPSLDVSKSVVIQLDGRILGYCSPAECRSIAQKLRHWKVQNKKGISVKIEIGYVPGSDRGLYPGLFISSLSSRLMRPVDYLPLGQEDYVGPFEQPFMDIACVAKDVIPGLTTHMEVKPTNVLSILANMTPFSDFNQSPRNMYQCQMSKQAMGTPATSLHCRTDNKAYLLQTGQSPLVRPPMYNEYGLDNFPNGMNAMVAVISYTGYDMDDAMIINKSSHERGFGDGVIYKTHVYSLESAGRANSRSKTDITMNFGFAPDAPRDPNMIAILDEDGIAHIGSRVQEGDRVLAYHKVMLDPATGKHENLDRQTSFFRYKEFEEGFVDQVRLIGAETGDLPCQAISVKYRIPRKPVVGDKFSSRHGQKGVCSQLWPSIDMPFSESGIQPDIIINPHAFPSRMTIGMFIESLAGKAGALHGLAQDSTPFQFSEETTASSFFGHQLLKAGFNFHGNEPMYSGVTGREFAADIYLGVVYYQRLRHMVNDKFQVRSTGAVNALTGQPVKGRSRGGGVRVGEMERDALIAHGAAFLLQDRLMNCSDATKAQICRRCGIFLSTQVSVNEYTLKSRGRGKTGPQTSGVIRCRGCARQATTGDSKMDVWEDGNGGKFVGGDDTTTVTIPAVLRYLDAELSTMGVKMKFNVIP